MADATNTVTLRPEADGTYSILTGSPCEAMRARLRAAGIGWFLGFDPKSATDRAEVESRIVACVGTDLAFVWGPSIRSY